MATYKVGKVKINGNGLMTGTGTNWTAANALVRVGATVVLATNPVRIYTVGSIISATSIQLSDWGSDAAITTDTNYSILLHDGLTVQGLAQDTAETLRYYRNFESTLGDAAKATIGEAPGNVMKVGAFGLGVNKPGGTIASTTYPSANALFKALMDAGCGWWRSPGSRENGIFGHGSSYFSYVSDTCSAINVAYETGRVIVLASNRAKINNGDQPARNVLYGSANPPDLNNETRGVLNMANGGTGSTNASDARLAFGLRMIDVPSNTSGAVRCIKIASIRTPGAAGSFASMSIYGGSGIGSGPRVNIDTVIISGRNSGNENNPLGDVSILHRCLRAGNDTLKFGLVKTGAGQYDVYMKVMGYVQGLRIVVDTILSQSFIDGPVYTGSFGSIGYVNESEIPTPTGNIGWASTYDIVNQYNKDIAQEFSEVTINRLGTNDNEARLCFNFPRDNDRGAILRSTYTNGNIVLATGHNGASVPVFGEIYLRTAGNGNSTGQFKFDKEGSATATGGQWKNSSDIRLKRNFKGIESPLESVMSFRGATYEMKASGVRAIGVIAQDIEKRCPDAIGRMEIELDGETIPDAMSVDTAGFAAAYSVQALKEVVKLMDLMLEDPEAASAQIKALKAMINDELPE